jgi:hypothetical protein
VCASSDLLVNPLIAPLRALRLGTEDATCDLFSAIKRPLHVAPVSGSRYFVCSLPVATAAQFVLTLAAAQGLGLEAIVIVRIPTDEIREPHYAGL